MGTSRSALRAGGAARRLSDSPRCRQLPRGHGTTRDAAAPPLSRPLPAAGPPRRGNNPEPPERESLPLGTGQLPMWMGRWGLPGAPTPKGTAPRCCAAKAQGLLHLLRAGRGCRRRSQGRRKAVGMDPSSEPLPSPSRGSGCASPPALGTALGTAVGTCHRSELELQGDGSRRDPPSPHFLPGAPHRDLCGDGGGAMPAPSSLRPRPRGAGSCPGCSRRAGQGAAPRECGWERPAGTHPPARPPAPCGTAAAPGPLRAPKPSPWDGEGGEGGALAVVSPHLL